MRAPAGAVQPLPADTPWANIDLTTHALTGWPASVTCPWCGGEAVRLVSVHGRASYECRGTPATRPPHSAYSDDRCGRVFVAYREPAS